MNKEPQSTIGVVSFPPTEHLKEQQIGQLKDFLQDIFSDPDIEAIKVLLSIYVSHFYINEKPVWAFLLGASGSGKSEIGIRSLEHLHGVTTVTELTPATFLSGYGEQNGLLHRLTKDTQGNGIIVFSDMTPLLNERPDIRSKVIGILRRVYDGSYEKDVGNKKSQLKWQGKLTCVAACTPSLEKYWSIHRSLGERFLTLRWRSGDSTQAMLKSMEQVGSERENQLEFKRLVRQLVQQENPHGVEPKHLLADATKLMSLATMIAQMRVEIDREQYGKNRSVTYISEIEAPTRIIKSMVNLVRASASLFRRKQACKEDYELAIRLGIDSLPRARFSLIKEIMKYPNMACSVNDIRLTLKKDKAIPHSSFRYVLEDLKVLDILSLSKINGEFYAEPTKKFADLWKKTQDNCLDKFPGHSIELD